MDNNLKNAFVYAWMAIQAMYDKPVISRYRIIRLALTYVDTSEPLKVKVTPAQINEALNMSLWDFLDLWSKSKIK